MNACRKQEKALSPLCLLFFSTGSMTYKINGGRERIQEGVRANPPGVARAPWQAKLCFSPCRAAAMCFKKGPTLCRARSDDEVKQLDEGKECVAFVS